MSDFLKGPVIEALTRAGRPLKSKDLARELEIDGADYPAFREFLRELVDSGELYRVKQGRYAPPEKINLITGHLQVIRSGAAFLVPEKGGDDVYISADQMGNAFDGDKVVARIENRSRGRTEGSVVRVLERARTEFVATLQRTKAFALAKADNPRFRKDIFVPLSQAGEGEDGQKVMVEIIDWGSGTSGPVGRVSEVLGLPGDPGMDILMIVKNSGLPGEFPAEVQAAADALPDEIPAEELAQRVDWRGRQVVTIDPPTARDFDDALSLDELDDGNLELAVHIADVSHYVQHGTVLDQEAWDRGTSVYLVDRVLPMLPEKISNHLCSLNPHVDRLAMSAVIHITPKGRILGYRIEDTVIRSTRRLTYEEVQAVFDGDPEARRQVDDVFPLLTRLRELAGVLNAKRRRRGALDFDLPSSRVLLDEEGLPIDIQKVVRLESMRLVEEFMLLANEVVAKHLKGLRKPGVYRIHEDPRQEKLDALQEVLTRFGLVIRSGKDDSVAPKELQRILREIEGRPGEMIVNTLVLRSLMRARYDIHPAGHYGLALRDYTHFTSPIRRYPDLLVHRLLRMESGRQPRAERNANRFREWLDESCIHSSERERIAERAERDSVELKKIQFMERHLGDVFTGFVSGVESFGFFVELEKYHVSGLVHVNNLGDEYFQYLESEMALLGSSTGRRFDLGDPVEVEVLAVRRESRQIDFLVVEEDGKILGEKPEESDARKARKARGAFEGTAKPRRRPGPAEERRKTGGRGGRSGRSGGAATGRKKTAKTSPDAKPGEAVTGAKAKAKSKSRSRRGERRARKKRD